MGENPRDCWQLRYEENTHGLVGKYKATIALVIYEPIWIKKVVRFYPNPPLLAGDWYETTKRN